LVTTFYMGAVLRAGGYRGTIIGTEHGELLLAARATPAKRAVRLAARRSGAAAAHGEVAVSDFMLGELRRHPHASALTRIHNGIELSRVPAPGRDVADSCASPDEGVVIGYAGRLIPGKGCDDLIGALRRDETEHCRLRIAGLGPERGRLERLSVSLAVSDRVEFVGLVTDMSCFWAECDLAAVPSNAFVESFGLVAVEAMAGGKPVVATRNGALPEVVAEGETGTLVPPGDVPRLAAALGRYAKDPQLRLEHGTRARERCEAHFEIDRCAHEYLTFLRSVEVTRSERRERVRMRW
jgi:glycosyltransferase involved in cell wall biosynthesis